MDIDNEIKEKNKEIFLKIQSKIEASNITQEKLAESVGITTSTYNGYLRNLKNGKKITISSLHKIAISLGINTKELL